LRRARGRNPLLIEEIEMLAFGLQISAKQKEQETKFLLLGASGILRMPRIIY
jgi:hypothetical protein